MTAEDNGKALAGSPLFAGLGEKILTLVGEHDGNLTFDGYEAGFPLIASYRGNVSPICDLMP